METAEPPWTTEAATDVVHADEPWKFTFMDMLYCVIAVLGIIGNGLVLYVFFKVRQLRVTTNVLIRHQSLVDFISSFLLPLTFVVPEKNLGALNEQSPFLASLICKMWYSKYLFWTLIKISTVNLVFLTLERYFAVLHPRHYRKRASNRTLVLVCAFAWLLGAMIEVYFPIIHMVHTDGKCSSRHISPGKRIPIGYISLFTTLLIPTTVMIFVYASIIRFLRRREATLVVYKRDSAISKNEVTSVSDVESSPLRRPGQPPPRPSSPLMTSTRNDDGHKDEGQDGPRLEGQHRTTTSKDGASLGPPPKPRVTLDVPSQNSVPSEGNAVVIRNLKKEKSKTSADMASRNILITMFIVCVTYVVCWTPDILLYWHHNVVIFHEWSQPFHRFAVLLAYFNVCTNPIIYTLKYRSFQNGLKIVFGGRSSVSVWITSHM